MLCTLILFNGVTDGHFVVGPLLQLYHTFGLLSMFFQKLHRQRVRSKGHIKGFEVGWGNREGTSGGEKKQRDQAYENQGSPGYLDSSVLNNVCLYDIVLFMH